MNLNSEAHTKNESTMKNVAISSYNKITLEDDFFVLTCQNETHENQLLKKEIGQEFIQFHFCLKGLSTFNFNEGRYTLDIGEETSLLLYNPQRTLPININLKANTWIVSILVSIKKFHGLFSHEADYITFLDVQNKDKKYYKDGKISPSMAVVLNQLMSYNLNPSMQQLYFKGKAFELLSLYFNREEEGAKEHCPFLADESNVIKIRAAKNIVIERMDEPPSLQELADEIGLSLKKLKEGFKKVYGETVYGFLFDYKMEVARKLLETGDLNVNEVGLKVGYSTASHFIAAFKKKYGTTPKKYVMSISSQV